MDPERTFELLGLVACVLFAAISSAADAALTAISRHRLDTLIKQGRPRAQTVVRILEDPGRLKATTLTLNIGAAMTATALLLALLHP